MVTRGGHNLVNLPTRLMPAKQDTVIVSWETIYTLFPSEFNVLVVNPNWLSNSHDDPKLFQGFYFTGMKMLVADEQDKTQSLMIQWSNGTVTSEISEATHVIMEQ